MNKEITIGPGVQRAILLAILALVALALAAELPELRRYLKIASM